MKAIYKEQGIALITVMIAVAGIAIITTTLASVVIGQHRGAQSEQIVHRCDWALDAGQAYIESQLSGGQQAIDTMFTTADNSVPPCKVNLQPWDEEAGLYLVRVESTLAGVKRSAEMMYRVSEDNLQRVYWRRIAANR